MNRYDLVVVVLTIAAILILTSTAAGQKAAFEPEMAKLAEGKGWKVVNRSVSVINEGGKKGVRFEEKAGQGLAWLEEVEFTDGTIEFDVRGKDVFQRSFVGIAFHGTDEKTHEAIYLRPFNFRAEDPARRSHAVQYVSHPVHTWVKLRDESPGKYEQSIDPAPDPNAWVHVRVTINGPKVSVFINDAKEPSLTVERLGNHTKGWVGLWVGNNSGGDFANLKIIPAK